MGLTIITDIKNMGMGIISEMIPFLFTHLAIYIF